MSFFHVSAILSLAAFTSGCGDFGAKRAEPESPEAPHESDFVRSATVPLSFYTEAESGLGYASVAPSPATRIFLVAGSVRGANFAQEVIEQKRLWLERGAAEDDIACYFVMPDKTNFDGDAAQYRELAPELHACRLASMAAVAADLRAAAATAPEHVYLYVSSHGDRPLSYHAEVAAAAQEAEEAAKLRWFAAKYPALDRYMVALDSTPAGTANIGAQLDAIDAGANPDDIYLTPHSLNAALAAFAPEAKKTVILRGCYTGGFIDPAVARTPEESLAATPQITVLTATNAYRPTFDCGVDERTTYFGGALLEALREGEPKLPADLDWTALHAAVKLKVEALEAAKGFRPSEPSFYSNR